MDRKTKANNSKIRLGAYSSRTLNNEKKLELLLHINIKLHAIAEDPYAHAIERYTK